MSKLSRNSIDASLSIISLMISLKSVIDRANRSILVTITRSPEGRQITLYYNKLISIFFLNNVDLIAFIFMILN